MLLLAIAVVLLLILLNGLFSMSELAVVSARRAKLQTDAERGSAGARAALALAEDPTRFLSAVQVGITLIGILAGAYGQATIAKELGALLRPLPGVGPYAEQVATIVVVVGLTYFSLVLGELAPKRLALIHAERIAGKVARPLALLARIMGPFVSLLTGSTAAVLRLLGVRDSDGSRVTQEEVEIVLAEGAGAGVIEPQEQAMMHEVMRLGDRPVRVAMTPRLDVYWVAVDADSEALRQEIRECPYSRFVVVDGTDVDDAIGVAHKSDVADALLSGAPLDLRALAKTPLAVPESTSLLEALEQLKGSKVHIAFVVDEFGGIEGVLTPTDLLEMIAGDFDEAHDTTGPTVLRRPDGSWLVDGRADLVELGEVLGAPLEAGRTFHTAAGLVLERLGRLPVEGEAMRIGDFEVEVVDMDGRRVDKLLFRRIGPSPDWPARA